MIKIDWQFPDLEARFKRKIQHIYVGMAGAMQANRAELFYSEGRYNGRQGWPKLKFREGMILQKRGTLRKSMAPEPFNGTPSSGGIVRFGPEKITIGTNLFYARLMNDGTKKMPGGVLRPVKAKALKIPKPGGGKGFIFRKSVRIPERRFNDWVPQDEKELDDTLAGLIAEVLNGKV